MQSVVSQVFAALGGEKAESSVLPTWDEMQHLMKAKKEREKREPKFVTGKWWEKPKENT